MAGVASGSGSGQCRCPWSLLGLTVSRSLSRTLGTVLGLHFRTDHSCLSTEPLSLACLPGPPTSGGGVHVLEERGICHAPSHPGPCPGLLWFQPETRLPWVQSGNAHVMDASQSRPSAAGPRVSVCACASPGAQEGREWSQTLPLGTACWLSLVPGPAASRPSAQLPKGLGLWPAILPAAVEAAPTCVSAPSSASLPPEEKGRPRPVAATRDHCTLWGLAHTAPLGCGRAWWSCHSNGCGVGAARADPQVVMSIPQTHGLDFLAHLRHGFSRGSHLSHLTPCAGAV